jgi:hypothetical protein
MGPPLLIGAGLGAATSLAMGKNPFMGALLGGATGGAFGGAGGFGSGFGFGEGGLLSGLKGIAPEAVSLGSGGYAQLAQSPLGSIGGAATGGINFKANGINSTLGGTNLPLGGQGIQLDKFYPTANFTDEGLSFADKGLSSADQMFANKFVTETNPLALDPRRMVVDTPLTFGEKLSDLGSSGYSYLKDNPTTALGGVNSLASLSNQQDQATQQRLNEAVATGAQPIQRKQFDPSSAIAAAPSYGLSREEVGRGRIGQIASQARLTDEDERRIGQFYQSLIG